MTSNAPSRDDLFEALIAAVEEIAARRSPQVAEGLHSQHENGHEPDFNFIAGALDVPLDRLTGLFSKHLHEITGDVVAPTGRTQ